MSIPFSVLVDWNSDQDYSDTGEDVSDDVDSGSVVFARRGKDQVRSFAPPRAGEFGATLHNLDKDYSPLYASSPLFGNLGPNKLVRWTRAGATLVDEELLLEDGDGFLLEDGDELLLEEGAGNLPVISTCILDDLPQYPSDKKVGLPALGTLSRLVGKNISTAVYQDITTSEALDILLDTAGWPDTERAIDVGSKTLNWWVLDDQDAFAAMVALYLTEGPAASVYESREGYFVFENNTSRATITRSTVAQHTFEDDEMPLLGLEYNPNFKSVIAACVLTVVERQAQAKQEVWNYGTDLVLGNDESKRIEVRGSSEFFINAATPSAVGSNTIFSLTPSATLTDGQFTVSFDGDTTAALDYDITDADLQTALEGLTSIGAGNVLVTGGTFDTGASFFLEMIGIFAGLNVETLPTIGTVTGQLLNPISVPASVEVLPLVDGGGIFLERQRLRPSGLLSAGQYSISVQDSTYYQTTGTLEFDDVAATLDAAISALTGYGLSTVIGGPMDAGTDFDITFGGSGEDIPLVVINIITPFTADIAGATIAVTVSQVGGVPDYVVTAGSIASIGLGRDSGAWVPLEIVAGPTGLTLRGLRLRAQPVTVVRTHNVSYPPGYVDAPDSPNARIYKPAIRPDISLDDAEDYAEEVFDYYGTPRPTLQLTLLYSIYDDDLGTPIGIEISDMIHVTDDQTGIDDDFHVEQIEDRMEGTLFYVVLGCEKVM
jgi:hypothetical protein